MDKQLFKGIYKRFKRKSEIKNKLRQQEVEKLPKLKYELQYGYYKLICPCEMDEIYGCVLNTTTPGASQASKISTAKRMNNLEEKKEIRKTKTENQSLKVFYKNACKSI